MSRQDIKKKVLEILNHESSDNFVDKKLVNEMQTSFLEYSMSVIKSRALPDYRDGLKPVHRRIIFAAAQEGLTHDKKYKKSAAIVGSVMGSYHPHGDAAIYDALVRMAQDFSLRYPLIQGQGNFGSIDGDAPAAMRYTEARLSELCSGFIDGLGEDWVEMVDNYDQSKKEPVVLPTLIPNLLVNGSEGIAVGLATKIPPHNLSEVVDAAIALITNPDLTTLQLSEYIPGPDFPTGGEVLDYGGVKDYLGIDEGRKKVRSFRIRGKARVEKTDRKNRERIIIEEIPYGVKKTSIIKQIVNGMDENAEKAKYIPAFDQYIKDIRDESSRDEIRIVIEFEGCDSNVILNNLYKYTNLQISYCVGLVVLINNEPKRLNVLEVLRLYVQYQLELIRKRAAYRIEVLEKRIHILEGRLRIVDDILEAVRLITTSNNPDEDLQRQYSLSDVQLKDIMSLQVGRLKKMSVSKMHEEKQEKLENKLWNERLLGSEDMQKEFLIEQLTTIKEKYGDERRTVINQHASGFVPIEETKHYENMVFVFSQKSYLSQIPLKELKLVRRRNKTRVEPKMNKYDAVKFMLPCYGKDDLLFFTDSGRVYKKRASEFSLKNGLESSGRSIKNLIPYIHKEEKIISMMKIERADYENPNLFLIFVTKYGKVKKTNMSKFNKVISTGKIAMRLFDYKGMEDKLSFVLKVEITDDQIPDLCLVSTAFESVSGRRVNRLLKCSLSHDKIRPRSRSAGGVAGIKLNEGQHVLCASSTYEGEILVVIGDRGFGKTVHVDKYRRSSRGTKGTYVFKSDKDNENCVSCVLAKPEDEILLMFRKGKDDFLQRIKSKDIKFVSGRTAKGIRLLNSEEEKSDAKVVYFTKLSYNEELNDVYLDESLEQE